jgi:UDP-glucose:(heptosyl)LPS alpha-1,3-glucosyltransferase
VVLVAHEVHTTGGMETATAELVRRAHGQWRFIVVACRLAPDLRPLVEWRRVLVPARPLPLRFVAFWLVAGAIVARRRSNALVHTIGALVPNRADVATVHYCHLAAPRSARIAGMDRLHRWNSTVQQALAGAAERWAYRTARTRRLLAVSARVGNELQSHFDVPVELATNGVDGVRFRPDPSARTRTRAQLAVGPDDRVVIFVGGDWGRKGLDTLLRALARLDPAHARAWVLGSGDVVRYRELAARLGVADRVTFFPPDPAPERLYQAADVFCSPSRYETFSMAAFEAAACGLPLVVTAVGDVDALVGDGSGGRIVAADPESVARALEDLLGDPVGAAAAGRVARARAAAYTWEASVAVTTHAYESLRAP